MFLGIKIITSVYFLILAGIVVLANNRGTRYLIEFGGGMPYFDKIAHFLLTGVFSFLLNLVFNTRFVSVFGIRYLLGSLIVFALVTIEEFSQVLISGRAFDVWDLIVDYAGIFLFGEIAKVVYERYRVR